LCFRRCFSSSISFTLTINFYYNIIMQKQLLLLLLYYYYMPTKILQFNIDYDVTTSSITLTNINTYIDIYEMKMFHMLYYYYYSQKKSSLVLSCGLLLWLLLLLGMVTLNTILSSILKLSSKKHIYIHSNIIMIY
jgi:hypothetical protein